MSDFGMGGDVDMESNFALDGLGGGLADYSPLEIGQEKDLSGGDGGVVKTLLAQGEGFKTPEKGDEVQVHYTGTLLDGSVFDSSRERDSPFTFTLGQGQVIKAWDLGIASMHKGEKAMLTCKPAYAYGSSGAPPKIPGDATLRFEVELLGWKSSKDLSGDGGVVKTVLVEGTGWEVAKEADGGRLSYTVRHPGAAADQEPLCRVDELQLDRLKDAPRGLALALRTMKAGETALLVLAPAYTAALLPGNPAAQQAALEVELTLETIDKLEVIDKTDGRVVKRVTTPGEGYERPNELAKVSVRLAAYLALPSDPARPDLLLPGASVTPEAQLDFTAGDCAVCSGLDLALQSMHKGESARVTVQPPFALTEGEHAGCALIYDVTLVSFEKDPESWDLGDMTAKMAYCEAKKSEGNALFAQGLPARAVLRYGKALKVVEIDNNFTDDEKRACKALKAALFSNSAACRLKMGDWKAAEAAAGKALTMDSLAVKARFRHAQALAGLGEHDEAQRQLQRILDQEPSHAEAQKELLKVKKAARAADAKDRALYARIFAQPAAKQPAAAPTQSE